MNDDRRLILLEGAPATGKSTTAAALHVLLPGSNLYTEFGCENPLYDRWTFMKYVMLPAGIEVEEPERRVLASMPQLSAEAFKDSVLLAARSFAATSVPTNIFDCTFIGSSLLTLFLSFEEDRLEVARFIEQLIDTVRELRPVLVYYTRDSIADVMATIDDGRPGHGDWVARLLAGSPYARRRGLQPTRGDLAVVLQTLLDVVASIYPRLPIAKKVIFIRDRDRDRDPMLVSHVASWIATASEPE